MRWYFWILQKKKRTMSDFPWIHSTMYHGRKKRMRIKTFFLKRIQVSKNNCNCDLYHLKSYLFKFSGVSWKYLNIPFFFQSSSIFQTMSSYWSAMILWSRISLNLQEKYIGLFLCFPVPCMSANLILQQRRSNQWT